MSEDTIACVAGVERGRGKGNLGARESVWGARGGKERNAIPLSPSSGARFRRNVNEERFCDASHITRHWTCANPYDLIDATEPFGSALANRFLTLDLFCFCLPTM